MRVALIFSWFFIPLAMLISFVFGTQEISRVTFYLVWGVIISTNLIGPIALIKKNKHYTIAAYFYVLFAMILDCFFAYRMLGNELRWNQIFMIIGSISELFVVILGGIVLFGKSSKTHGDYSISNPDYETRRFINFTCIFGLILLSVRYLFKGDTIWNEWFANLVPLCLILVALISITLLIIAFTKKNNLIVFSLYFSFVIFILSTTFVLSIIYEFIEIGFLEIYYNDGGYILLMHNISILAYVIIMLPLFIIAFKRLNTGKRESAQLDQF